MTDPVEYRVTATNRHGDAGFESSGVRIAFDGTAGRRSDIPGPAELFAASFAACTLKNIERFSQMLPFSYREAHIDVTAVRAEDPPRIAEVRYELAIDTDETDARIDLLRRNIEKFGTIYNTVGAACTINGRFVRSNAGEDT